MSVNVESHYPGREDDSLSSREGREDGGALGCIRNKIVYIVTFALLVIASLTAVLLYIYLRDPNISGNLNAPLSIDAKKEYLRMNVYNAELDSLVRELKAEVSSRGLEIVPGPFNACAEKGWKVNCVDNEGGVKGILEWEIVVIANLMHIGGLKDVKDEVDTIVLHKKFNHLNGIHYSNQWEYWHRYYFFKLHKINIDEHNKNPNRNYNKGYSWSMEFSDMEAGPEMQKRSMSYTMYHHRDGEFVDVNNYRKTQDEDANDIIMVDWRTKNVFTPVIDQGKCGSCWAVAAASLVDAYRAIKTGELVQHSPQQLLDCVDPKFTCGTGGNHMIALKHVEKNGICTMKSYPYVAMKRMCYESMCVDKYKIDGITKLDHMTLEEHVRNHGPALVTIRLSRDFMDYTGGIFDGSCRSKMVHSLLIVGFGINKKTNHKFWIVRNSWGPKWVYGGYFKLSREPKDEFTEHDSFCYVSKHAFGLKTY